MDIISIDSKILQHFDSEKSNALEYKSKIDYLEMILSDSDLEESLKTKIKNTVEEYQSRLNDIQSDRNLGFYISETHEILEKYKKLLKTPVKVKFFGSQQNTDVEGNRKEKEALMSSYILIAQKYAPEDLIASHLSQQQSQISHALCCDNCGCKKSISDNFSYICTECGFERDNNSNTLSYKDINRTNVLQKGAYEERSHFKDALNQYQGKQNCKIDRKIFEDLETEFRKHHLLKKTGDKFSNIKKDHVMLFLKELGYDKQYENANYIYSEMTGIKCPDITHIEEQLIADFDVLVNLYTKKFKYEKNIERKSFINIQCVLFQLLLKNKHPCKKDDFNILKTTDRKTFHDDILRELFEELGWNYTPFF